MPDVNGSSFHLLLTEEDWFTRPGPTGNPPVLSGAPETDLEWTPSCGLRLRRTVPFDRTASPVRLSREDRRGSDRDPDGVFWHVGEDRTSLWRTRDGDAEHFWPPADPAADQESGAFAACAVPEMEPPTLGGVAATADRWLVVGVLDPGTGPLAGPGLVLLDLLAGGEPVWRDWSHEVPDFAPIDACRLPGGGLLVLDASPDRAEPTRVWPLDRHADPTLLQVRPAPPSVFDVCDRDPAAAGEETADVGVPVPWVLPVERAVSVAAVDETSYVVLDAARQRVLRFEGESLIGALDLDNALASRLTDPTTDPAVRGHDIAVAQDPDGRRILFVSDAGGDEVFTFDIDADFAARAEHYPMRRHHGRGLVTDGTTVWFDTRRRWHPLLGRGRSQYRGWGTVVTAELDGHQPGCRWHRVALDGRLPDGTSLRLESRAADDVTALVGMPWRLEPTPYLRHGGTELSLDTAVRPPGSPGLPGGSGTWETLLQRTDGRYCQLRLTMESAGGSSPEISALRLIYPRFSYLHRYLPQVYADQDAPTRFLERYLANPEGLLTDLEGRIADVDLLFDGRSAPAQYLGWLASWLGAVFDADLDVRRRRLFIEHAQRLFATRGTPAGLVLALRLVLDECPEAAFGAAGEDDPAFTVRVAERYLSRSTAVPLPGGPMVLAEDEDDVSAASSRWSARLGANELHQRFQDDLVARYGSDWSTATGPAAVPTWLRGREPADVRVSPTTPLDAGARADWSRFLRGQLGLRTPAFDAGHLPLYRRFLLQRYEQPARFAATYQLSAPPDDFDEVDAPERLPSFGPALEDWEVFVSLVVPIAESAHRFSVLLPVDLEAPERDQLRMLDRARRVVELEKPAHTAFDVRPYWAAFQLGDARLGVDTRLGAGARRAALVLDRSRLAQAGLAPSPRHTETCGCP